MSKILLPAVFAIMVLNMPAVSCAQGDGQPDCGCGSTVQVDGGCGCESASCQPTRLKLCRVQKEVTRCRRVCTIDECGCRHVERVPVTKCVTRLQWVRVPREPRCGCQAGCGCQACDVPDCGCH